MGGRRTECSATTTSIVLEAAHFAAVRSPAPRAGTSCRARPPGASSAASTMPSRRRPPRPPSTCSSASPAPRPTPGSPTSTTGSRSTSICLDPALPGAARRPAVRGRRSSAAGSPTSAARSRDAARRPAPGHAARPGARTCGCRSTWSRRSSGSRATTRSRPMLPRAAAGRGLTRSQRLRRNIGRALADAGYVEVLSYPFVGTAALDALGLPAGRPAAGRLAAGQPDLRRRAAAAHDPAAGPAGGPAAQRRPRCTRRRAVRDRSGLRPAAGRPLRRSAPGVDGRPTDERDRRARRGPARAAAAPRRALAPVTGHRRTAAGGARPAADLGRGGRRRTAGRGDRRRRGRGDRAIEAAPATPAVAPPLRRRRRRSSDTPASCTRG